MQTEIDRGPNLTPDGTKADFGNRRVVRGRDRMDLAPLECPCDMAAAEDRDEVVIDGDIAARDATTSCRKGGQGPTVATIDDKPVAPEPGQHRCGAV